MVKIGMMIGERYEILEKIGTGGMSDVYKAKCHKLNRLVAIKVLKQEFAENANFVSKFKIEAQAAAGLMHPNIVNVYDVGEEENGIYYIVMELVEGITLKKYIEKKARLSIKESVTIAIQIGMGIEAAHNNKIIHRDIKPQNVIISKEGKVKVTDFGIAKAATSNTITSNVMGSVHYTSPEQARGGYSDEKSDIYSLGITLFEMLTGRVPFNGDTTVAIAIKQIQEEMPSPREFVEEIPVSVEQIVLKCTQKSPDRRYQSMGQLIDDLKQSFITPDEDFVRIDSADEGGATRRATEEEIEIVTKAVGKSKSKTDFTGVLPSNVDDDNSGEDEYDHRMDKVSTILIICVAVLIFAVAILLIGTAVGAFKLGKENNSSITIPSVSEEIIDRIEMPNVTTMAYDKAMDVLEKNGLKSNIEWEESEIYEKGTVISTSIQAGLKVDVGTTITITVSSGTTSVIVPEVVGYSLNAANKAIMKEGLSTDIQYDYSDEVAEGVIIRQYPDGGAKAPEGSSITIYVSKGKMPDLVEVPVLVGKSQEDAVLLLNELGFTIGSTSETYNEIYDEGIVCYQNIVQGTSVEKGTVIDIQVSRGAEPAVVETYKFSAEILAPSTAEDPEYVAGTEVFIVIKTDNGKELLNTSTKSFPQSVNYTNIPNSSKGTITLSFDVTEYKTETVTVTKTDKDGNPITDSEGNTITETKQVLVEGETTTHTIVREITFVKE